MGQATRSALLWLLTACATAPAASSHPASYASRRAAHRTHLLQRGPVPNRFQTIVGLAGVEAIRYRSAGRELKAFLMRPSDSVERAPALVYLHGNFELEPQSFDNVRSFVAAGYVVLLPTYRGEQGNPGAFELLYGEVDDAAAAVRWLSKQPFVDAARVDAIGHSVGGAIAALLSLVPALPLRSTASVGGIYVPETFARWTRMPGNRQLIRFDVSDREELELRVLGPHVHAMQRPHVAYVGRDDHWFIDNARRVASAARRSGSPFRVQMVAGDHMSSLAPALAAYRELIASDDPH